VELQGDGGTQRMHCRTGGGSGSSVKQQQKVDCNCNASKEDCAGTCRGSTTLPARPKPPWPGSY
jgi:hypothetical protein